MKIQMILDQIDLGSVALPEFQRGYVWNREQVRNLMHSLIGSTRSVSGARLTLLCQTMKPADLPCRIRREKSPVAYVQGGMR